jgi:hypothetical protein
MREKEEITESKQREIEQMREAAKTQTFDVSGFKTREQVISSGFYEDCAICGAKFAGYGHNPAPVKTSGRACDSCNETKVIPARIARRR